MIVDARNKIIQRNRSKIADARDKLAEITKQSGDVRQKLMRKQQQQQQHQGNRKAVGPAGLISASASARNHQAIAANDSRRGSAAPRRGHGVVAGDSHLDDVDMIDVNFVPAEYALRRTVHNDIAHHTKMPPLPHFAVRGTAERPPPQPRASVDVYHPQQHHHHHQQQHHLQRHHPVAPHSPSSHHRIVRPTTPPQPSSLSPVPMHHHATSSAGWSSGGIDPFDCYVVPMQRPHDVSETKHLQRHIRGSHPDLIPTKGILRYSSRGASPPLQHSMKSGYPEDPRYHGAHHQQQQHHHVHHSSAAAAHLSYEMRSRLERAPDSGASAGSFSNPYSVHNTKPKLIVSTETRSSEPSGSSSSSSAHHSATNGYRIVISNLHSTVSQSDIRELFEDIGELVDARLVRPGVSEVIFRSMKDAELAVDTYHNRQLDGQPMKCLLVHPRAASRPTAPAIKVSRT